jgi:LacI family transcriptional regulator
MPQRRCQVQPPRAQRTPPSADTLPDWQEEALVNGKRTTLADVARAAGLSTTAASQILNGKPDTRFSEETRKRVHEMAARLNYRPNVGARALRTDRSLTIGFISDVVATTRFASGLIRGAVDAAQRAGHVVLMVESGGDREREQEAVAAVLDRQVDGIIFATMSAREITVPDVPDSTRVVMLNATNRRHGISVLPDEENGGRSAVELLAEAGHREGIAIIGRNDALEHDSTRSATVARRVHGMTSRLAELSMRLVAEESCLEWEPENGHALASKLLDSRDDVKAIICMNDRLSFGAYHACMERGLSVGKDISIVSFDDDEVAAYLRPGLTTIGLPYEQMGREAVTLLLGEDPGDGERLVAMQPVVRASIARVG